MNLTIEQRAILEHRIIDVDAWLTKALAEVGEKYVTDSIQKYRASWLAEKDKPGYKTAAERAIAEPAVKLSARDLALNAIIKDAALVPTAAKVIKDYAATLP